MSIFDVFGKGFNALGKADLMKTNEKLGLNLGPKSGTGGLTEDQLREKQLELLKQQIADANATKGQNSTDWTSLSNDLFGGPTPQYTGPMAPADGTNSLGTFTNGANEKIRDVFGVGKDSGFSVNKLGGQESPLRTLDQLPQQSKGSLGEAYAGADTENDAALADLKAAIGGIKNPELSPYVGDMTSEAANAAADPNDIAAQGVARDKLLGLTDVQETAQERLMREIARRKQEQSLQAQREAMKNDLQSRGVYGSGAEIGTQLASQQKTASRRALEELGADANAQNRAMAALKNYGDLSTSMRGASAGESQFRGTAADKAAAFNKGLKQQDDQFKAKTLMDQNEATARRAAAVSDASRLTTGDKAARASDIAGKKIQTTAGKTGGALSANQATLGPTTALGNLFGTQADLKHEEDESDTPFGSLGLFK